MRFLQPMLVVASMCQFANAQSAGQRPAIVLGMSGDDVRKILGPPQVYRAYLDSGRQDFSRNTVGVRPAAEHVGDVWEIKTLQNTYELETQYRLDDSESQLHPVPRVTMIRIRPDKRISKNDFRSVLQDIPEALAICGEKCTVKRYVSQSAFSSTPDLDMVILNSTVAIAVQLPELDVRFSRGSVEVVIIDFDVNGFHSKYPVDGTWVPQQPARN